MNTKKNEMSLLSRVFQFSGENNTLWITIRGKEEGMSTSCLAKRADVMVKELKELPVCFGPKQNVALISSTGDIIFYLRLSLYNNGGIFI